MHKLSTLVPHKNKNPVAKTPLYQAIQQLNDSHKRAIAALYVLASSSWLSKEKKFKMIDFLSEHDQNDVMSLLEFKGTSPEGFLVKLQDEQDLKWTILWHYLNFTLLEEKKYDSRMRTSLMTLASQLGISFVDVAEGEYKIGLQLQNAMQESKNIDKHKKSSASSMRWLKLGSAALIGGGIIAISSILAAPVVIPALVGVLGLIATGGTMLGVGSAVVAVTGTATGLITFGGTPLLVGIFGLGGGGLTAYKLDTRLKGVQHFKFTKIVSNQQAEKLIELQNEVYDEQEQLKEELIKHEEKEGKSKIGKKLDNSNQQPDPRSIPHDERVRHINESHKGMQVFIGVWGCLNYHFYNNKKGVREFSDKWMDMCELVPHAEHFVLEWEPKVLQQLGHAVRDFVVSTIGGHVFKLWLAAVSTTASVALGAVMGPLAVLKAFQLLNNPWSMAIDRAEKTAKVMASVLKERTQGNRPVSLIGVGIGARVIFNALLYLSEMGEEGMGIVENVYLIGAAVDSSSASKWSKARSVVSGRFVNAYCKKDYILAFLFRGAQLSTSVAGLSPVKHSDVENISLDDICNGYSSYEDRKIFQKVLKKLDLMHCVPKKETATVVSDEEQEVAEANKQMEEHQKENEELSDEEMMERIRKEANDLAQTIEGSDETIIKQREEDPKEPKQGSQS